VILGVLGVCDGMAMKFVHRIGLRLSPAQRTDVEGLGVKVPLGTTLPDGGDPLVAFDIDEAHPNWLALHKLFEQWGSSDLLRTEFWKKEIEAARWLRMLPGWHQGYPQPEDGFGYLRITYNPSDYCPDCGIGAVQKAPFRMQGEPRWGKYHVIQLNWVFDEFFTQPEVWRTTFEPFRIGAMPVVRNKTGQELKTVVQLGIPTVAKSKALLGDHPKAVCPRCKRAKYLPFVRGRFPPLESFPDENAFRTTEYFGDGARAFRGIIVSDAVYREVVKNKLKGIEFKPVASS
jgi:rRNA maturation protein Nop10